MTISYGSARYIFFYFFQFFAKSHTHSSCTHGLKAHTIWPRTYVFRVNSIERLNLVWCSGAFVKTSVHAASGRTCLIWGSCYLIHTTYTVFTLAFRWMDNDCELLIVVVVVVVVVWFCNIMTTFTWLAHGWWYWCNFPWCRNVYVYTCYRCI